MGSRDDTEAEPGELGRYVLLGELGRGAIGIVYAAYHEGLDRKLAIKVLNQARAGRSDLEARLRREAQALAKLSHPNVVQVYDVGELDGRVFVVMEFVEGQTLGEWMYGRHTLDEILAMLCAAGRGLAAAHAAGVVHRDFKPDNVIVGDDGRPRVLDFGLARTLEVEAKLGEGEVEVEVEVGEGEPDVDAREPRPSTQSVEVGEDAGSRTTVETHIAAAERDMIQDSSEFLETVRSEPGQADWDEGAQVLTRTGARMGTPAYMSPEQFMAKPVDAASDQFSFCVALHEAVYGRRPFTARTQPELIVQVHAAAIIEAPAKTEIPTWLREIILRGLRPNPNERWPSMDALLAALERRPEPRSRRRRLIVGLALGGVIALAVTVATMMPERASSCPDLDAARARLWTSEQARSLGSAFARSRLAYADVAWSMVESRLSTWAQGWAVQRVAVCEATQLERRESSDSLDRRHACLDRDRRAFEALLAQFAEADRTVVERAVEAVAALPDPARCGELEAAGAGVDAPPALVAVEVVELRNHLAELDTRLTTGREESGLTLARAAVEQARATGYGPVLAEALLTRGRLLTQLGGASGAEEALTCLQDALDEADRSGHHELVPLVATELVSLSIYTKPDPVRGRLWARRVLSGFERLERAQAGGRGRAQARGIWALGNLERLDGDNEQAEQHLREALELLDAHAPGHPDRAIMLNDLGNVLTARGERDLAQGVYERALRESMASFGEGHPRVGNAYYNLARLAREQGQLVRAREHADLAFLTYADARGVGHRDVGAVELLRASIELDDAKIDAARDHASRAKEIYDLELAADNLDRAEPHQMLGNVAFAADELEQAIVDYQAALAIKRAALPAGHIELAPTVTNLGLVYLNLGRLDAAVVELAQAVELLEAGEGVDPERLRASRLYLGDALMQRGAAGDQQRAEGVFEAALDGCSADPQLCSLLSTKLQQARGLLGLHVDE